MVALTACDNVWVLGRPQADLNGLFVASAVRTPTWSRLAKETVDVPGDLNISGPEIQTAVCVVGPL